jgi:hypothetical protein
MAVTLGTYSFDDARTAAAEEYEETGGRDGRSIVISGVLEGFSSLALLEAELDAILRAASEDGDAAVLSLRPGRRLFVRRTAFRREIQRDSLTAAFQLELFAEDAREESETETEVSWNITASGDTQAVIPSGNAAALPVITLTASGMVSDPVFSDGARSIAYAGEVADGESLVLDGAAGTAALESEDVTPYTSGVFPVIDPGGTVLTYTDGADSSHTAAVTLRFRDRWW